MKNANILWSSKRKLPLEDPILDLAIEYKLSRSYPIEMTKDKTKSCEKKSSNIDR